MKLDDPTITTFSGKTWHFVNPDPNDVDIIDLAHHTGNICRFHGATKVFYSVAQHNICVGGLLGEKAPLEQVVTRYVAWGLIHDAAEAYLGDVASPWKHLLPFEYYRDIEAKTVKVIIEALGLDIGDAPPELKEVDRDVFFREQAYLMNPPHSPDNPYVGKGLKWGVLPPHVAAVKWLECMEAVREDLKPRIIVP